MPLSGWLTSTSVADTVSIRAGPTGGDFDVKSQVTDWPGCSGVPISAGQRSTSGEFGTESVRTVSTTATGEVLVITARYFTSAPGLLLTSSPENVPSPL